MAFGAIGSAQAVSSIKSLKKSPGELIGEIDGMASRSIPGELDVAARSDLIDDVGAQVGRNIDVNYSQTRNGFDVNSKELHLKAAADGPTNRGVLYEELQHLIDDAAGINPAVIPKVGTLENALFHREVFERMANNPLFDITAAEADDLAANITVEIMLLGGSI